MSQKVYLYEKSWDELAPVTCEVENWQRKLRMHPSFDNREVYGKKLRADCLCEKLDAGSSERGI